MPTITRTIPAGGGIVSLDGAGTTLTNNASTSINYEGTVVAGSGGTATLSGDRNVAISTDVAASVSIAYTQDVAPVSGSGLSLAVADARYLNTTGNKLRRASASPSDYPGQTAMIAPQAWVASTVYTSSDVGTVVANGSSMYALYVAGTAAGSGGPTGTDPKTAITDGTCIWRYVGPLYPTTDSPLKPTITHVNGTPSGLTRFYNPNPAGALPLFTPAVQFEGGTVYFYGGGGIRPSIFTKAGNGNIDSATGSTSAINRITFVTDAPDIALGTVYSQRAKIWVDGVPLWVGAHNIGTGSGTCHVRLDFTGLPPKVRTITMQMDSASVFGGVWVGPTYQIWQPTQADQVRVVWVGDSYAGGASQFPDDGETIPRRVARRMGWQITVDGIGGTSFSIPNSLQTYLERVPINILGTGLPTPSGYVVAQGFSPYDLIVLQGSTNGYGSNAAEAAAAAACVQAIRADSRYATTPIIVTGVTNPSGNTLATTQGLETAIFAAVVALGDTNVYTLPISTDTSGTWNEGTGHAAFNNGAAGSVVAGDGKINSRIICGDAVHPNSEGMSYFAGRYERALKALLQRVP